MNTLNVQDIKKIFNNIMNLMNQNKDLLTKLDSALGDGDLGMTMCNGFNEVVAVFSGADETKVGKLFIKAGMVFSETVPSTMGTLMASGMLRGGKCIKDEEEIDLKGLKIFLEGFMQGIADRGKAQIGDKTILDVLHPAINALSKAEEEGMSIRNAVANAFDAAQEGLEKTKTLQAKHGRASRYGEKSAGIQDPGGTVGVLIIKGFKDYIIN